MNLFFRMALCCALALSSTNAFSSTNPMSRTEIQDELNNKWANPLLEAFNAETCGQHRISENIITKVKENSPKEILESPITYGFVLGYSNHLSSLEVSAESKRKMCNRLNDDFLSTDGYEASTTLSDAKNAVEFINVKLNLSKEIGQESSSSILLSIFNLNNRYSDSLNKKLLLEACEINSNSVSTPSLLNLVNSAGFTQKPTEKDIRDLAGAWVGFSQGMYWHAVTLVQRLDLKSDASSVSEKQKFCEKVVYLKESELP